MIPTSKTAPDGNPWAVFSICIDEAALILVIFQLDFLFFKDCVLGHSFWIILSTFLKQRDPHKAIIVFCNKEVRHGVVKMILQKIVGFDFWKAFFFKVAKYQLITIQVIFQIIKNGQSRRDLLKIRTLFQQSHCYSFFQNCKKHSLSFCCSDEVNIPRVLGSEVLRF